MGSRKTHEGAEHVYEAAQKWVDCALRKDDSLFTPGKEIWSSRWLGKLREQFLDRPDVGQGGFYDKLSAQLEGSPAEVYQLMGEVLYVHFLIVWHGAMKRATKEAQINRVLRWSKAPVAIPPELADGLSAGLAHPGTAFNTYRPYQVGCIIEFAAQWKGESIDRDGLLTDPWRFKDFVIGMQFQSALLHDNQDTPNAQRLALLHLVHAATFEGTVAIEHKNKIAEAKAFAHFVPEPPDDVDVRIQQIRQGLKDGLGRDFDFYDPDVRRRWYPSTSEAWDAYIAIASEYLPRGRMWPDELKYKYEIAERVAAARKAALEGAADWPILVKKCLPGNIIPWQQQDNFRKWIDGSLESQDGAALQALQSLWQDGVGVAARIRAFSELFPRAVTRGTGVRMNVISQLLMGIDPEQYPPFRVIMFDKTYERTGYEPRRQDADEAELYEHALGFLDRFIEEARDHGVPVRHRLDAQSLVWMVPYLDAETRGTEPPPADPDDRQALSEELFLTEEFLEEIEALLEDKKQVIFQGPPGTGKTYVAQALARHLAGSEERVTLVQLHPSYAYEDFVQGFRPTLTVDGQAGFALRDGPLLRAAKRARAEPDEKHFLVIDEINRGAPAKVLGELYFLLEYRDEKVRLQYQRDDEEDFSLPPNLYFIGTMNTADRSIALVDLALRRRFYFVEFHPDDDPVKGVLRKWLHANAPEMEWVADVVVRANKLLERDRHAAIGPSYFMKDGLDDATVERVWKHSVLSYIEERLFGEGDRLGEFDLRRLREEAERAATQGDDEGQVEGSGDGEDTGESDSE